MKSVLSFFDFQPFYPANKLSAKKIPSWVNLALYEISYIHISSSKNNNCWSNYSRKYKIVSHLFWLFAKIRRGIFGTFNSTFSTHFFTLFLAFALNRLFSKKKNIRFSDNLRVNQKLMELETEQFYESLLFIMCVSS